MKAGVNVYGYVYAESGVGEHTRLLISSLKEGGIPYAVVPFKETLSRQEEVFSDLGEANPEFDINIIGVNADSVSLFVENFGASALEGRYNIGLWAWELEDFPEWMADSADLIDEVWANSSFSARAIARKVLRPVQPFPLPIKTPTPPPMTRHELGIPEDFLYLFCFDLDSIFSRKNPLATIEAYKKAFPEAAGTCLMIKSVNADRHPDKAAGIEEAVAGRPDIIYRDGYLPAGEQGALMAACDAYVSLHRSEGFGLTMAEAMALGKPVIATGYSGNMDFMNDHNSFLIPYRHVQIGPGSEPYPADVVWAEPDIDAAAQAIRRVREEPDEAGRRGLRAIEDIANFHSPAVRSRFIVDRISTIRKKMETRAVGDPLIAMRAAETPVVRPKPRIECNEIKEKVLDIAGLINGGPNLDAPTVIPLGRTLRKLMLRLNTNQFLYQQEVNRALLDVLAQLCHQRGGPEEVPEIPSADSSGQWVATAAIVEESAGEVEENFGAYGAEIARNLRLLAARMRGFSR